MITKFRPPLLPASLALLAVFSSVLSGQQAGTSPVKIFIMAGQSNMLGQGYMSPVTTPGTLDYIVANDPEAKYQFLKSGGNYVVRDDVWIRDQNAKAGGLAPGWGSSTTRIGPELGFGHRIGDHFGNQVLIVKCAWGGKDLAFNFCPPSLRIGTPEPVTSTDKGFYYKEILRLVNEAKSNLGSYFPTYNGGGYEIAGFGWHQGWNDRIDAAKSAAYKTNMANFINDIRNDLQVPDMPFVIATTGMDGLDIYTEVERAQLAMGDPAQFPAFAGNVKVIDTRGGYDDLDFWQQPDLSPLNEGYHWNRNAKTYLHIGLAMGDAMSLMTPDHFPYRLKASGNASGVTLSWQNGTDPLNSVQVIRNGITLDPAAPVNPASFLDTSAQPGLIDYQLVFDKSGTPCPPLTITFNGGITGLRAYRTQTSVRLTWQNNLGYDAIVVRRNGTPVGPALAGTATSFLDTAPPASGIVTYSVVPTNGTATPAGVQIDLSGASAGQAVIYEPFEDSSSTLVGNAPGPGLTGTWSGTGTVTANSLSYGSLPAGSGNKVSVSAQNGFISIGSSLGSAGLLEDGASLWFSVLVQTGSDIATNGDLGFALGTEYIGTGNNLPIANSGRALGFTFKNNLLRASFWGPGLSRSTTNTSSNGASPNTLYLVVGKFTWGATSDKLEIYKVAQDLTPGSPVSSYTTASNLDQSLFDTITFAAKTANPAHLLDEIRFGATFEDVIGKSIPGPGQVDHFAITPIASPQTAGTPITGITITAKDAADQTATGFTGTVAFGGSGGFTGTSATFVAGVLTGVSVTPTVAGPNLTFTVTDSAGPSAGSTTIATIRSAYDAWSGGAAFDGDSNGDGIANGLAWLLGAPDKGAEATSLLPTAAQSGGNPVLNFTCLKVAKRGGAVLKVQSSNDLGVTDPWTSHEAVVPDTNGTANGVVFSISAHATNPALVNVQATIPGSPATRLFGRLKGTP